MALSISLDPRVTRKAGGVAASAALHLAFLLVIMIGGSQYGIDSGDSPTSKLLLLEAPDAEHREGVDLPPLPAGSTAPSDVELDEALARLAPPQSEAMEDQAVEPGLERDLQRIERLYRSRGYYQAQVRAAHVFRTGSKVRVEIVIEDLSGRTYSTGS